MESDLLSQLRIMMKEELEPIRTDIKSLKEDIKNLKEDIKSVNNKVDKIAEKLDITYDQVARCAEDVMIRKRDLSRVEMATASNWVDIARLKAIK